MRSYGFLATRRWIGLALAALLVSAACVGLGLWQWNRHADRAETNALVETNYDRAPVPLADVLDPLAPVPAGAVWRPVELTGRYTGADVLVRNRPVAGTPAKRVLTPFAAELDGGRRLLVVVDRGWMSTATDSGAQPPAPPSGEVRLTGRVRAAEQPGDREPPPGQVYRIEPGEVLAAAGVDAAGAATFDGYVLAVEQEPEPAAVLPSLPRPETDPGPHLSYAFQWWVFALGAPVGLVVLARREAAERAGEPVARPRHTSAEAEEDALIDAQLGSRPPPS